LSRQMRNHDGEGSRSLRRLCLNSDQNTVANRAAIAMAPTTIGIRIQWRGEGATCRLHGALLQPVENKRPQT
jgi:hypothetical protein